MLLEALPTPPYVRGCLTDFGVCKLLAQAMAVRAFRSVNLNALSLRYAAPEVISDFRGQREGSAPPQVVKASDVYSLAALMYHSVTRYPPWSV